MKKSVPSLIFAFLFLSASVVFAQDEADDEAPSVKARGRSGFSFSLDGFSAVGFKSDRYDVYFDVPAENMTNAGFGGRIGIEGVQKYGFGVKFLAGYQRVFYSNVGIQEIKKNYVTADLLFTLHVPREVKKWDWYIMAGPSFLVSSSGAQGYLTTGGGVMRFVGRRWSVKAEPSIVTDFSGVWGKLAAGVDYHF